MSSLFQLCIKLGFSLFYIKVNPFIQICSLFLLLPFFLYFTVFDTFRNYLGRFFVKFIPESTYLKKINFDDYEFPEDVGDDNNKWYNHLLLYIVHFFITIRMILNSEPVLSFVLKLIAINYFITNNHLTIAYTISLVFILSRLIFLLSDKTLSYLRLTLGETLFADKEEMPQISIKNINVMTFWSLRGLDLWQIFLYSERDKYDRTNKYDYDIDVLIPRLKDKHDLQQEKIITKTKNQVLKKFLVLGMSFLFFYFIIIKIMK